ncbi:MAG TPA: protease modulator HflC [Nitrospirae bacterium]|nr:modulator of FtsH protease HflC [bacterium BMS3Abin10]GBE38843.1 modulator of FtsH protease HflC [bacterium BMS3Bbin08]HDH50494.1 protease modulator HflC [Nitrospirota bacterium]HDK81741.1 protease modulator HflC [Nitrospirota bacterium]
MKQAKYIGIAIVLFIVMIVFSGAAYVVKETDQVVITQFGKPVGDPILTPGIHFKIPFIQKANFFDKRFLEWDGDPNQVPTKDKRFIWVDTYARWRIHDPLLFFQRVRDERGALTRLSDILDGETRNAIAKHVLVEIVRSTNREYLTSEDVKGEEAQYLIKIKDGREKITRSILEAAAPLTLELGIELLDLRLKRINYVEAVRQKIFERMITERRRKADKFRSEGQGEASKILGDKERELKRIQSEAYKTAQEIIGKADAEATAIYASAYNKNQDSREFYSFLKTMETYKETMSEKDWLILGTKGDFFKYLQNKKGR